jgi:hypothetical protein
VALSTWIGGSTSLRSASARWCASSSLRSATNSRTRSSCSVSAAARPSGS